MTETAPKQVLHSAQNRDDIAMMSRIRERFGAMIVWACSTTAVRPALVAALVASESGGNPDAQNLETGILKIFRGIKAGTHYSWGMISEQFLRYKSDEDMIRLATSYGLTQITGYNVVPTDPAKLFDPEFNLVTAVHMLQAWAVHYQISNAEPEKLLRCWNTGHPDGKCAVDWYVPKGLQHLATYEALAPSAGGSTARPAEPSPAASLSSGGDKA